MFLFQKFCESFDAIESNTPLDMTHLWHPV